MSTRVPLGNTYDKYSSTNRAERWVVDNFMSVLRSLLPPRAPDRALEVGTGEGEVLRLLQSTYPTTHLAAVDLPGAQLAANVHADAHRLPFPDDAFELVVGVEVLEHLEDPSTALKEIARVLAPGGALLVSVPAEPLWRSLNVIRGRYVRQLGNTPGHVQHWTPGGFRREVSSFFDVASIRRPLPWTVVLARWRER